MDEPEKSLEQRTERERADVLRLRVVPLRRHGRVTAAEDGDELLSVSVGPAGQAVALWSAAADREALTSVTGQSGRASVPDTRTPGRPGPRLTF